MWANAHAEQLRWSSRSCCWHPRHAAGRRLKNRMVTAASKDEKAADHATGVDKIAQESVAGAGEVTLDMIGSVGNAHRSSMPQQQL